jgi:hypothetical protein
VPNTFRLGPSKKGRCLFRHGTRAAEPSKRQPNGKGTPIHNTKMQSLSRNENRAVLAILAILVHGITLHNNDERWDAAEPAMHRASGGIATSVWIILEKMTILAVEMIVTAWAI